MIIFESAVGFEARYLCEPGRELLLVHHLQAANRDILNLVPEGMPRRLGERTKA
jgi:hypothetical protein